MSARKVPLNLAYFQERSAVDGNGCWIWQLWTTQRGYPILNRNRKKIRAHRAAYEAANGPIPAGATVDHICFVPACVNPDHLQILSRSENSRRQRVAIAEACPAGHMRDAGNLHYTPGGRRVCKACRRERDAARWASRVRPEPRTHCPNGHEYTPENTATRIKSDGSACRRCRKCRLAASRRRNGSRVPEWIGVAA